VQTVSDVCLKRTCLLDTSAYLLQFKLIAAHQSWLLYICSWWVSCWCIWRYC